MRNICPAGFVYFAHCCRVADIAAIAHTDVQVTIGTKTSAATVMCAERLKNIEQ